MSSYQFFQNRECEFFPCHKSVNPEEFNCLFCYCPLYTMGEACGGAFCYTEKGIKDCSNCSKPHWKDNYQQIVDRIPVLIEPAKNKDKP